MKKEITKRASVLFLSMILTVTMISPAGIAKGKTPVLSSKSVSLSVKESTTVKIKADKVYKLDLPVNVAEEVKPFKADRAGFSIWPITDELFYRGTGCQLQLMMTD